MKGKEVSGIILILLLIGILTLAFSIPSTKAYNTQIVKAFVLDSWGSLNFYGFWDYLNSDWETFGDTKIIIDYTTLDKEDISLEDLINSEADVLIISDAWSDGYGKGWEYTDSEINAIKDYVMNGHGIIATAGSFDTYSAPNNRKLADLFGMNAEIWYQWGYDGKPQYTSGPFELQTPRHSDLWINIPDPYITAGGGTLNPEPTHDWTQQGITTGWLEAVTSDHLAAIITSEDEFHRSVYITTGPEAGPHNLNDDQLFYNAIVWAGSLVTAPATINIEPDTINLRNKGKWITAYIELPEGYDVSDIDVFTILLGYTIPVNLDAPSEIGDYDEDEILDLMVKFDRAEVMALLSAGYATLAIAGEINGISFEGTDTIRVINE